MTAKQMIEQMAEVVDGRILMVAILELAKPSDIAAISPMYLQRKLGISWATARRAMDEMVEIGILWPIDQYGKNSINRDMLAKAAILIYKKTAENKEESR